MASRKTIAAAALTAALATGGIVGATLGTPFTSGATGSGTTTSTTVPGQGSGLPGRPGSMPGGPQGGHRGGPGLFGDLSVAAKVLGISEDDLRKELQSGKSLADVAKAKGVDKQKLIDALVDAATKRLDEEKAKLPDRIAAMVDGKAPSGGKPGGPGGMGGPGMGHRGPGGLEAAAKVLGMSVEDLGKELWSGKSLADVAKAKGVDKQKVIDAMVAEAKDRLAQAVKDGHLTQAQADERAKDLTQRITDMVDGKMPKMPKMPEGGMPGGMGHHGMGPGGMGPGGMGPDGAGPDGQAPQGDGGN